MLCNTNTTGPTNKFKCFECAINFEQLRREERGERREERGERREERGERREERGERREDSRKT
jgi:hypothetical protein